MPNGGSDCCGTCWFNAQNKGQAGYRHTDRTIPAHCTIGDLPVKSPYYTYCANHPHRSRERDPVPIGPVFTGDSSGRREFWMPAPHTEEVKRHLLELLAMIQEQPTSEYPIGAYRDEVVVWQLGEFCEPRATEDLRRIAAFDPSVSETGPFGRDRNNLVVLALEALSKIEASDI